ncbi:hypothetical protein M501DRAFT_988958 [Patellaria atrata CBS 101060]|uniref:BRCT domain-containing protein n=1 Tax=Patellaria atrata CBS 101060 TaxID=1346257 RepID=A0A9P4S461_9PEZI|nr:hypothetical protein M501DRAFT_988958 [Patellaria atrata CBS 101060]
MSQTNKPSLRIHASNGKSDIFEDLHSGNTEVLEDRTTGLVHFRPLRQGTDPTALARIHVQQWALQLFAVSQKVWIHGKGYEHVPENQRSWYSTLIRPEKDGSFSSSNSTPVYPSSTALRLSEHVEFENGWRLAIELVDPPTTVQVNSSNPGEVVDLQPVETSSDIDEAEVENQEDASLENLTGDVEDSRATPRPFGETTQDSVIRETPTTGRYFPSGIQTSRTTQDEAVFSTALLVRSFTEAEEANIEVPETIAESEAMETDPPQTVNDAADDQTASESEDGDEGLVRDEVTPSAKTNGKKETPSTKVNDDEKFTNDAEENETSRAKVLSRLSKTLSRTPRQHPQTTKRSARKQGNKAPKTKYKYDFEAEEIFESGIEAKPSTSVSRKRSISAISEDEPATPRASQRSKHSSSADKYTGDPPKVLFSNSTVSDKPQLLKFLRNQGGSVTDKVKPCNILCIAKTELKKTAKLLLAVTLGKPIVTDDWILKSAKAGYLLAVDDFPHPDINNLASDRTSLFSGMTVWFTPVLKGEYGSGWKDMKEIVESTGAKVLSNPARDFDSRNKGLDTIVLAAENGDLELHVLQEKGLTCYHKDLVSSSIIRGTLDLESEEFVLAPASSEPKKKGRPRKS